MALSFFRNVQKKPDKIDAFHFFSLKFTIGSYCTFLSRRSNSGFSGLFGGPPQPRRPQQQSFAALQALQKPGQQRPSNTPELPTTQQQPQPQRPPAQPQRRPSGPSGFFSLDRKSKRPQPRPQPQQQPQEFTDIRDIPGKLTEPLIIYNSAPCNLKASI